MRRRRALFAVLATSMTPIACARPEQQGEDWKFCYVDDIMWE